MAGPRDYSKQTIKRLYGMARNKCSFPGCETEMSTEYSARSSNICHIEAAYEGGQRWNPHMTNKARADYENLILLCQDHHDTTNDVTIYTVAALKHMKEVHVREMEQRCAGERPLEKKPTLLAAIVNKIATIDLEQAGDDPIINSFPVEKKIEHNNVIKNQYIIQEYSSYQGKLNVLYSELERNGSRKKEFLLKNVRQLYLEAKGQLLKGNDSIENIQVHADDLLDYVKSRLHELIDTSLNTTAELPYEMVEFAISIIMVDCFMRCKILEEPK